ncbi:MAG: hypothetical protein KGY42_00950 [Desulfobacterales bacterium]|nr:hypothetical protein [Desulfobacterales bacterium]MBS3754297.1 hypothetical protein [Desulfobacterales bacterium]
MTKRDHKPSFPLDIEITPYSADIPINRLLLGVDNLRYDVRISPQFCRITGDFIFQLILKHANTSGPLQTRQNLNWYQETEHFKAACTEVMTDAINQAKSAAQVQIDYLAQVSLVKWLMAEMQRQYDAAIQHFKSVIRRHEVTYRVEHHLRLREEVFNIIQRRSQIIQHAGAELFDYFLEARAGLNELRTLNFGQDCLLAEELLANPLLHAPSRPDDFFMMTNYVLLGYRLEDPLNYHSLITILCNFFSAVDQQDEPDEIIKSAENINQLFNLFETRDLLAREKKKKKPDPDQVNTLKSRIRFQKQMLAMIYREFRHEQMLECIVAAYEVPRIIQNYCPPLSPQELLQYLVAPKSRKNIIRKIKRFRKYTGKSVSMARLKQTRRLVHVSREQKRVRIVRFLKDFAVYHRDLNNYYNINEKADSINLIEDKKTARLSRENNTLYEFMFPREHDTGKQTIINHVVIKADVRGSTEIIDHMKAKGLNPASNFALNFFDPINNLLPTYGAQKIFIEGDAAIMAIFEHEGLPEKWYGVARACGLSINMLMVVQRYNQRNIKKGLPRLDLGIGVSFAKGAPTFFYDNDNRIMISHSINEADILSGCNHELRKRFQITGPPFNVYLYQLDTSGIQGKTLLEKNASPILRYNVMGIELAPDALAKLAREIHMKRFEGPIPKLGVDHFVGYTGKFPTLSGNYQRLVIREAVIPEVSPTDFHTIRMTEKKYYEVCTHPGIYEHVKHL